MHSNLLALVATLLFLAAKAEGYQNCYKAGVQWSTLGDSMAISDTFVRICDRIGGKQYKLGETVSDCENIGGHRVDISIKVKEDSYATGDIFELNARDCQNYLEQVEVCKHGGLLDIEITGSHKAKAAIKADPQWAQC